MDSQVKCTEVEAIPRLAGILALGFIVRFTYLQL